MSTYYVSGTVLKGLKASTDQMNESALQALNKLLIDLRSR